MANCHAYIGQEHPNVHGFGNRSGALQKVSRTNVWAGGWMDGMEGPDADPGSGLADASMFSQWMDAEILIVFGLVYAHRWRSSTLCKATNHPQQRRDGAEGLPAVTLSQVFSPLFLQRPLYCSAGARGD